MALFKLTADDGEKVWTRLHGTPDMDLAMSIAADPRRGVVYICGLFSNGKGLFDSVLLAVDADSGAVKWQRVVFGGPGPDYPTAIAIDHRNGDVYLTGIGVIGLTNAAVGHFAVKLSSFGELMWSMVTANAGFSKSTCAFNPIANELIVLGGPTGNVIDGQTPVPCNEEGDGDVFLMRIDPNGTKIQTAFVNAMIDHVAINHHNGDVYLGGQTHLHAFGEDVVIYKNAVVV